MQYEAFSKDRVDMKAFLKTVSLVEKPVRCAQLMCDSYLLRLGGDLEATARSFSTVQNDVHTTRVMLWSQ